MKVEIIVNRNRFVLGKVLDLPEKEGRALINGGLAKLAGSTDKPQTEGKKDGTSKKAKGKGKV